ncbi:MAG: glycosyltransferase [Chthoniobacter sp.]
MESEKPTWSNYEDSFRSVPIGAGVCLRRVVVETYAGLLAKTPARARLDRSGHNLLLSGADWDLALTAVDCGLGTARFPELKVKHLIKKERLVLDYLLRLHIGIAYATTWVKHFRGTLRRPYLEDRIAARLGEIRLSALERKFAHATRSGVALAQADIRAANTPGLPTAASMFETLLARLPAAPPGKDGWPWTIESPTPAPGDSWPRITVVTPSYMQGEFLEQTIRAVLLQNYPNLEYFVLDGGSTDGSREIIEKYAPWLAGWRCETDRGPGGNDQRRLGACRR